MDAAALLREKESLERAHRALALEAETMRERARQLEAELDKRGARIEQLERRLKRVLARLYGRRSEKIDPAQLALDFSSALEEEQASRPSEAVCDVPDDETGLEDKGKGARKKKPRRRGRIDPPANAPRERIVHEPDASERLCPCCREPRIRIGEDVTEEIDYRPARLIVREHVRPKYACRRCPDEGVLMADPPARPIVRGRPGAGLLAHIVTSKYADHLPLYRIEGMFAREGWTLARSTLCDWIGATDFLLRPIVDALKRSVRASEVVQVDDTSVKMQKNWRRGGIRRCHLWSYVGDRGDVVYDFTLTRAGRGPVEFLDGYEGFVQADAFSGFDELFKSGKIVEVGCWAHARRRFHEAMESDPAQASVALALIQGMYRVEREAKESEASSERLLALRRERSKPALSVLREWLDDVSSDPLRKTPLAGAVTYTLNQWDALARFVDDPRLSIDNNACERTMRRVALGRKNWLFTGSEDGGKRAANLYSIIESCRLADVNVHEYLADVLERVNTHPSSRVDELIPRAWKDARFAEASTSLEPASN